jgi:pimeloyl-ACP methyl ester carboxylesterase
VITPYTIAIPDADVQDLRNRLAAARWPAAIDLADNWSRGVPQPYLRRLAGYWQKAFDWRKQEARLNAYPQFVATMDGQPLHFFHVRSRHQHALPLLLLHGWPSSNVEFVGLLDRLTDPVAHGGDASDAFHVVLPAIPGFGLSSPMHESWDAQRTATALCRLMSELGYTRWGVHGGDVGADVAGEINHIEPNLVGVHLSTDTRSIVWFAQFIGADPLQSPALAADEKETLTPIVRAVAEDGGYLELQKTRPLTIGYLLADSPVGQLAWMVEKLKLWMGDGEKLPEDHVNIDQLLTTVSLYWFTNSGALSAQFLSANLRAQRDWGRPSLAPMGMAVFNAKAGARTLHDPERRIEHWSEFRDGGHFPAMEVPELLVQDLRVFFHRIGALPPP